MRFINQCRLTKSILLLLTFIGISITAYAYDDATIEEAAAAYSKGYESVQSKNWSDAVRYLKQSYHKVPTPLTAYLICIASSRLDDVSTALEYGRKAVEGKPPLKREYISDAKEIIAWAEDYPDISSELLASADVVLPKPPANTNIPSSSRFPISSHARKERTRLRGVYTIQQKSNGRYVDAHEGTHDNAIVTRKKQNNDTQHWLFTSLGKDTYTIQQKSSGRYVDAHEGRNDNAMVTRDRQNNDTQRWILTPLGSNTYTIQQKSNGRYVDAHEGRNDNALVTRDKQNNDTQRWIIKKTK